MQRLLCLAALFLFSLAATAQNPRPLAPEDIYLFRGISNPQLSPDKSTVTFVVKETDRARNDYQQDIWLVPTSGGRPRRLTTSPQDDFSPRWSPDGKTLAFISTRTGQPQLWLVNASGGPERQLTRLPDGALSPVWSPDSSRLVFVSFNAPAGGQPRDFRHITRLRYRTDTLRERAGSYLDDRQAHLWVVPAAGGEPRKITQGDFNHFMPSWSPDGRRLAFIRGDLDEWWNTDLWTVSADGSDPRPLVVDAGANYSPSWSPDGHHIAYLANRNWKSTAQNNNIWLVPSAGGPARNLTASFDRSVGGAAFLHDPVLEWTPDGQRIYFAAADRGNIHVFQVTVASGAVEPVTRGSFQILDFQLSRDASTLVYTLTDPVNHPEVYVAAADGSASRALTSFNREATAALALSQPEEFWFKGADGVDVQGWVMKPVGYQAGRRYPTILQIHGGPHWWYGNGTDWFFEFQYLAGRGYLLVYCNPRGSVGYGEKFAEGNVGDWGGVDYRDVMRAVDVAVENGWADPDQLGVTGLSYGGFLTNWIVGQTRRFKAAVSRGSISNFTSFYGTSDIPFFVEEELQALPWENPARYAERSPLTYAGQIQTPTLFSHSELDFRVPIEQSEQLYAILKRRGIPTEFLRWPDEGHMLFLFGAPSRRVELFRRIGDWFDRYLK